MTSRKPPRNEEAPGAATPEALKSDQTLTKGADSMNASIQRQDSQLPVIAGHEIAVDQHGRFSLSAIFRASGEGRGKEPSYWTVTKQAKELIAEVETHSKDSWIEDGEPVSPIKTIRGGKTPGTYAHELLAVSYAGWISPKFQLQVNQVFLDYRMGKLNRVAQSDPVAPQPATRTGITIGTDGFRCLAAVLDGKLRHLPAPVRKRAKHHVWQQVHKAFSVVSAEDIPADQMEGARNFIGSYTLEGEWLEAKPEPTGTPLSDRQLYDVYYVSHHFAALKMIFERYDMYCALRGLGSRAGIEMIDHFTDGYGAVCRLKNQLDAEFDAVQRRLRLNHYGSPALV